MARRAKVEPPIVPAQLRSFGLIVGGVFLLIALWPAVVRGGNVRIWPAAAAGLLVVPALIAPTLLRPVYTIWMAFGEFMGRINSKIILGLVFYLVVTPIGLLRRLLGKDPMRRRFDANALSYRVAKTPRPASHLKMPF